VREGQQAGGWRPEQRCAWSAPGEGLLLNIFVALGRGHQGLGRCSAAALSSRSAWLCLSRADYHTLSWFWTRETSERAAAALSSAEQREAAAAAAVVAAEARAADAEAQMQQLRCGTPWWSLTTLWIRRLT